MTGEHFPALKEVGPCRSTLPAEARNALFSGTSVVGGDGVMLVVETGTRTRFGAIAAALAHAPPTAIEEGVRRLGMLILYLTLFLTLLFCSPIWLHIVRQWSRSCSRWRLRAA